jgi:hypothetical protein
VSGDSCLGLLCVHIQLALIECLFMRENYVSTHHWWSAFLSLFQCKHDRRLGVHSAIDCQVRASDVRRFRTGDECHHCGDIVNMSIAVECGGGLLWHRPITGGGVQIRIDGAGLDIIDRDAPGFPPLWLMLV